MDERFNAKAKMLHSVIDTQLVLYEPFGFLVELSVGGLIGYP